jgi:hypothetical protein
MARAILSLAVTLLLAVGAGAFPTASFAEDIVMHIPLRLTEIQPDLANRLYIMVEFFNNPSGPSLPHLNWAQKIPVQNGQYIGTITVKRNYNPPGIAGPQGPARFYRVTVTDGTSSPVSALTAGIPTTMVQPIPAATGPTGLRPQ